MALAADDSFADILARSKLGIAMAAMINMIATTISNSINENPVCFRIARPSGFLSNITMHAEGRFGAIGPGVPEVRTAFWNWGLGFCWKVVQNHSSMPRVQSDTICLAGLSNDAVNLGGTTSIGTSPMLSLTHLHLLNSANFLKATATVRSWRRRRRQRSARGSGNVLRRPESSRKPEHRSYSA
jgi:hypothetical protein